jgi:hypothetical protein
VPPSERQASGCLRRLLRDPEARLRLIQSSVGVVLLGIPMLAVTLFEILFRRRVASVMCGVPRLGGVQSHKLPFCKLVVQMCGASRLWFTLAAARAYQLRTAIVKLQGSQSPLHRTVAPEMVVVID